MDGTGVLIFMGIMYIVAGFPSAYTILSRMSGIPASWTKQERKNYIKYGVKGEDAKIKGDDIHYFWVRFLIFLPFGFVLMHLLIIFIHKLGELL